MGRGGGVGVVSTVVIPLPSLSCRCPSTVRAWVALLSEIQSGAAAASCAVLCRTCARLGREILFVLTCGPSNLGLQIYRKLQFDLE